MMPTSEQAKLLGTSEEVEQLRSECSKLENVVYLVDAQLRLLISLTTNLDDLAALKGHELAGMFEGLQLQLETVMK